MAAIWIQDRKLTVTSTLKFLSKLMVKVSTLRAIEPKK